MSAQLCSASAQRTAEHQQVQPTAGASTALLQQRHYRLQASHSYGSCDSNSGATAAASERQLQRPQQQQHQRQMATKLSSDILVSQPPVDAIEVAGTTPEALQASQKPQQQQQQPTPPKKATLLSLAAKAPTADAPAAARLEDIVRKGIDIAREFDASAFTGRPGLIKLVVDDRRRQSLFERGSSSSESVESPDVRVVDGWRRRQTMPSSPADVVIEMPPEPDEEEVAEDDEESASGADGRWRLRLRRKNHSDSSKAPLISDV